MRDGQVVQVGPGPDGDEAVDVTGCTPAVVAKAAEVSAVHLESVRRAAAAGVGIAMETDSGVGPHGENLDELALMQECGMTPEHVLAAATSEAVRLCGLQGRTGRLEPGLAADLLVGEGDGRADRPAQAHPAGVAGRPPGGGRGLTPRVPRCSRAPFTPRRCGPTRGQ